MQTRRLRTLAQVSLALVSLALLTACGGGSSTQVQPSTPVFTSAPVTAATQGVAYTYQLAAVDPAGGTVTFSMTTSPTGAALSGSTITWTPTAAESRVANSFAVTATTTSGGTASQTWTVTPGGTITVNWVNTYWTATGPVQVPESPSLATNLSAMWTNPDGSITVQKGSWTSSGVFSIPNVPAGYYWLQTSGGTFWTNTGTFDAGGNIAGGPLPTTSSSQPTTFLFNLSGLDGSVPELTPVDFQAAVSGATGVTMFDNSDSTSLTNIAVGFGITNIDWSQISTAFLMQYVPVTIGPSGNLLTNLVLGPSLTLTGLTLVDGQENAITDTLLTSPTASINLSVPGASQWAPLLTNAAPSAPTPFGSALLISAQLYVTEGLATGGAPLSPIVGISPLVGSTQFLTLAGTAQPDIPVTTAGCSGTGFTTLNPTAAQPAITTDTNFGALQYGDPFPSAWARTISLCQESTAAIPIPDSSATATFILTDSATVAPSNTPLAPVVLPVQNPTINGGGSIFGATALNSTIVTLSWSAPAGTVPFGYTVRAYVQITAGGIATYAATGAALSTANTSITLPPLAGGNTYVFSITAEADGTANMQTSPFRSSLPTGYATVVSGPVTISSSAEMPEIHGDRRVITRLSQAQPSVKGH